jgi:Asp-tRNA(Asn)/Glu-tRNA(Gln) amidotransferase A subunit family amidase
MPSFNFLPDTASVLQRQLTMGDLTSAQIVDTYLAQVKENDHYLRAVLQFSPKT